MSEKKRIIITGVHRADAHYMSRDKYVGKTGMFGLRPPHTRRGYYAGDFCPDDKKPLPQVFFLAIRYKKL